MLLVIPFLAFLFITTLILIVKRKWKAAIIGAFFTFVVNNVSETFPLHFFSSKSDDGREIKVMTYNVYCLGEKYNERQVAIAKTILDESPDIVFLCEFVLHKSAILDSMMTKRMGYLRYYQKGISSVFYSKYAIDSISALYHRGSDNCHSLNNKVHVIMGKDTLTIVGCHLSSSNNHIAKGYENRRVEADSIYANIKNEKFPIIVMGDFNDISGSYAINRIKKVGLEDAWWRGGFGYGTTYHDKWLRLRLDHILFQDQKIKLLDVKVIDSDLSDHNAVVAEFTLI